MTAFSDDPPPGGTVAAPRQARLWATGKAAVDWPTVLLIAVCTAVWAGSLYLAPAIGLAPALIVAALCTTLHSSLQHETIHGHPTRHNWLNALLVLPAFGLFVPYQRFRDLHIHHHRAEALTDPAEDPESFYLTADQWRRRGAIWRGLLRLNNTLLGRMTIGPALSTAAFYRAELARLLKGDRRVWRAWLLHLAALVPVTLWVVAVCGIDPWIYVVCVAYPGYGLLMLRTFAEHQAHADKSQRTAIIEDRGPLAWLFLFNNLHVVHHRRPDLPWYALPRAYWRNRRLWAAASGGYVYRNYGSLIVRHLLSAKEPVRHPAAILDD